jgi:hypothetical protein
MWRVWRRGGVACGGVAVWRVAACGEVVRWCGDIVTVRVMHDSMYVVM